MEFLGNTKAKTNSTGTLVNLNDLRPNALATHNLLRPQQIHFYQQQLLKQQQLTIDKSSLVKLPVPTKQI